MMETRGRRTLWASGLVFCSIAMWGCPSAGCPYPVWISGIYQERVNCDEANMCVIEDEMDMVTIETDVENPRLFSFVSLLTGLNGRGTICGTRAEWQGSASGRTEEGTWTFDMSANTYERVSSYSLNNLSGSCTGSADRLGPPGPPAAVGVCPPGTGGAGGAGGSDGCVPFSTAVGGTEQNPVIWEELYTCIDPLGACIGTENTAATLELVQNNERIDWEIVEGTGKGSMYAGNLCNTSFEWSSKPMTEPEDGCWEFTSDRFNKRSFGAGFRCVGSGSKGAGSMPTPAPTCEELAAASVVFSDCPEPPPAAP